MKIVYDISVLGTGYYGNSRAGIFRVAEQIAYGLHSSQECNPFFCTAFSPESLIHSIEYLIHEDNLVGIPYLSGYFEKLIYKNLKNLVKKDDASAAHKFLTKVWRKALSHFISLQDSNYTPLYERDLYGKDIFHSPFYALPKETKAIKGLQRFITVYDLIPVLYPDFFKDLEAQLEIFNSIIGSLTPDDWVLCISRATRNDLLNHVKHLNPDRVIVTHLAASNLFYFCKDLEKIRLTKKKYLIPNERYILSLSTLEPRKNISHVIRSFCQLVKEQKISDLNLVLAGSKGWQYDSIFDDIDSAGLLRDRIIVTGYVDDEDLAALYSGALAFVYPSFYEGFGLPPLEAMQCGTPVITSNTSSLPEVVGAAGIQLDPFDREGLCQSIFELYRRPELREEMSLKSINQAKNFSWETFTQGTINAYKKSL
ncbi:glycosyltransferase family 4 protein [Stenomitos frigidus]|uniref:Glycosyltransferase family 1 protein n=1 Tax=Stenomitos frigidus ULC18 TaxID=2107698 RepID=A0A2T1ESL1_9CYAN|nr:glycosyltransferase family 1 protein [Stenomitos frigidus]PSB35724.1 glycosyltransferase family 1 protein [Stenomitos frigidus ULC18]